MFVCHSPLERFIILYVGPLLVDQSNTVTSAYMISVHSNAYQSFTPSRSSRIKIVEVFTGSLYYGFNMVVGIYLGVGRTGPLLGSAPSTYVRSDNGAFFNFTLSVPVDVVAGTQYSIGLDCSGTGGCGVGYSEANPYPGGKYCLGSCSGRSGDDMAFRTYSPATINSCSIASNCPGNLTCTSTGHCINSCGCPTGYTTSNTTCFPINNCATRNGGCDAANGVCTYTGPGTSTCACKSGFFSTNNGITCTAFSSACDGIMVYQSTAPSATNDRVCSQISTCVLGSTYEKTAPSTTSNRVCADVSVCELQTTYEKSAPTLLSNRVCVGLTVCDGYDTYQTTAPSATSDRVCTPTTVCTATQYQSVAATPTSNRVCASCLATQYVSSATTCSSITNCTSSQYETKAPTLTSDRVCNSK